MIKKLTAAFLIWLIGGWPTIVFALPSGGKIVSGTGSIVNTSDTRLDINQTSSQLSTTFDSFNTTINESVYVNQANTSDTLLVKVLNSDPTIYLGKLIADGQVFISNGSGVFFGPGSQIDVHGLVATTLDISNQDFLDRNYRFAQDLDNPLASVINEGVISATSYVGLLAPAVENRNKIVTASLGSIDLASGTAATMDFTGDGLIQFEVTQAVSGSVLDKDGNALEDRVSNAGLLQANGGQIRMSAKDAGDVIRHVVNMEGTIRANSVVEKDGKVFLMGGDSGIVNVSGTIDASGDDSGEKGGTVHVTGEYVGLFDNAKVDVSGDAGGGTALIGGDYQGKNPTVQNAKRTYVSEDAVIDASSKSSGDGGKAIIWADDVTRFYGSVFATGGNSGGDGGFIEISGKENLHFRGEVDASSIYGVAGTVLFDPKNITVTNGGPDTLMIGTNGAFNEVSSTDITFDADDITAITNTGTAIILQANNDITINEAITSSNAGSGGDITLQAGRSVLINANITTDGGALTIVANETTANGVVNANRDSGTAVITMGGGTTINAGAGNVSITMADGTGKTFSDSGDITLNTVTTSGNLVVVNNGATTGSDILQTSSLTVTGTSSFTTTGDGVITLTNASNSFTGGISIVTAGGNAQLTDNSGTALTSATTSGGNLTILTTTGGIALADSAISTGAGNVSLTSTTGSIVESSNNGTANITTTGTVTLSGATGIGDASAIDISGATALTFTSGGNLQIVSANDLTDLNITVTPTGSSTYSISAGGSLVFNVSDTSGDLEVTSVTESTGLNLSLTAITGNIIVDSIIISVAGNITLNSVLGSITEKNNNATANITTGSGTDTISLTAGTSIGASGSLLDIATSDNLLFDVNDNLFVHGDGTTISSLGVTVDPSGAATYTVTNITNQTFTMSTDNVDLTITDVSNTGNVNQTITAKTGNITLTSMEAGTTGNISVTATAGNIDVGTSAIDFTENNTVTLGASGTISGLGLATVSISQGTKIFNTGAASIGSLTLSGGTLTANGTVSVTTAFDWATGASTISGSGTFTTGNFAGTISDNGTKTLDTVTWNNQGTTTFGGGTDASLDLTNGATVNNSNLFTITSGSLILATGSGAKTFNNSGTFTHSSASNISIASVFNNTGTVSITSTGDVTFSGTGTDTGVYSITNSGGSAIFTANRSFSSAASFTGTGSIEWGGGTQTINTSLFGSSLTGRVSGGQADFNADITIPTLFVSSTGILNLNSATVDITVNSDFTWSGGTIKGTVGSTFTTTSGVMAGNVGQGGPTFTLDTTTWNNAGTITFDGGSGNPFELTNDATFNNSGTFEITVSSGGNITVGTGASNMINNSGTFTHNSDQNITVSPIFNNTSTVNVSNTGNLTLASSGTDTGNYAVTNASANLAFSGGTRNLNGVTISGSGIINFSGGTIQTNNNNLTITASNILISVGLDVGTGDLTIIRSGGGSIGVNTAGNMVITDAELGLITANNVNIGDSTVGSVTVVGITANTNISGTLTLMGSSVDFNTTASTIQNDLAVVATSGTVTVSSTVTSTSGDISITADKMDFVSAITASGKRVKLKSYSSGDAVDLGESLNSGIDTLELSDAELDLIFASYLEIGSATQGAINVSMDISPANIMVLHLISNSTVTGNDTTGGIVVAQLAIEAGGNVTFTDTTTDVDYLAISAEGFDVNFYDTDDLDINTVDTVVGVKAKSFSATGPGPLTVTSPIVVDAVEEITPEVQEAIDQGELAGLPTSFVKNALGDSGC